MRCDWVSDNVYTQIRCSYLCECEYVVWGRRCRWILCRTSYTDNAWCRCDTWRDGWADAVAGTTCYRYGSWTHCRLSAPLQSHRPNSVCTIRHTVQKMTACDSVWIAGGGLGVEPPPPTVFSIPLAHCQIMFWGQLYAIYIWFTSSSDSRKVQPPS